MSRFRKDSLPDTCSLTKNFCKNSLKTKKYETGTKVLQSVALCALWSALEPSEEGGHRDTPSPGCSRSRWHRQPGRRSEGDAPPESGGPGTETESMGERAPQAGATAREGRRAWVARPTESGARGTRAGEHGCARPTEAGGPRHARGQEAWVSAPPRGTRAWIKPERAQRQGWAWEHPLTHLIISENWICSREPHPRPAHLNCLWVGPEFKLTEQASSRRPSEGRHRQFQDSTAVGKDPRRRVTNIYLVSTNRECSLRATPRSQHDSCGNHAARPVITQGGSRCLPGIWATEADP